MKKSKRTTIARGVAGAVLVSSLLFACGKGLNNPNRPDYFNFRNFAPSGMLRTMGVPQITLAMEHALAGAVPEGHREKPEYLKDDESLWVQAEHSGGACGITQTTIEERAAECAYEWDGPANTGGPAAKWRLVTRTASGTEVWQDLRTGLVWSDQVDTVQTNWCDASGNRDDTSLAGGENCTGYSGNWCKDSTSLEARGGMGSSEFSWRMPTIYDWMLAETDGIRFVLPRIQMVYWSSSPQTAFGLAFVRVFDGVSAMVSRMAPNGAAYVRCVARLRAP